MQARSTDDGEPSGTAGMPILNVLCQREITDTLCVVTRYFGGTLLGAGGLVRAYAETASAALEQAGIVSMHSCTGYRLTIPYPLLSIVQNAVKPYGVLRDMEYGEQVIARIWVADAQSAAFAEAICSATDARIQPLQEGSEFREAANERP